MGNQWVNTHNQYSIIGNVRRKKSYNQDLSSTYDKREKDILKATVSWPFYSGGKNRAKYKILTEKHD